MGKPRGSCRCLAGTAAPVLEISEEWRWLLPWEAAVWLVHRASQPLPHPGSLATETQRRASTP